MPFERIIQRATEPLYGDEQLRSNLADEEARVVLDWAVHSIEEQVISAKDESSAKRVAQRALARVRPVIGAINALAAQPGEFRLSNAVAAVEPALKFEQKVPRTQVFELLTILASALWRVQSQHAKSDQSRDPIA